MRVLIADDSAVIRTMLEHNLVSLGNYEIVSMVSNGEKAFEEAQSYNPDLIITDYDMPIMDGLELCKKVQSKLNIPVVFFSENESVKERALESGARLFISKPDLTKVTSDFWKQFSAEIEELNILETTLFRENAEVKKKNILKPEILVVGASTGGPNCIVQILKELGNDFPLPILLVQHIEIGSDKKMVAWFNSVCTNLEFKLARNGEKAYPGTVYMAPADVHLELAGMDSDRHPVLKISHSAEEHFLRPAVNVLFRSAAKYYKQHVLALLLTGMGRDGAEGCKTIIENGGYTIVEDKSSCVIFGMPAAAIELQAAKEILPRNQISKRILEIVK